jgi:hypothetical protein
LLAILNVLDAPVNVTSPEEVFVPVLFMLIVPPLSETEATDKLPVPEKVKLAPEVVELKLFAEREAVPFSCILDVPDVLIFAVPVIVIPVGMIITVASGIVAEGLVPEQPVPELDHVAVPVEAFVHVPPDVAVQVH